MKRRGFIAATLALPGWLGGCAGLGPGSESDENSVVVGPPLQQFSITGRLSLRQGERRDHLGFDWQHSPQSDSVLLLSPLGQGLAEIIRGPDGAQLKRPNAEPVSAPNLAVLAQQVFGVSLPLQELGEWVRGARGRAGTDNSWAIRVLQTVAVPDAASARRLPRRLEALRADIELSLIVDDWAGE